MKQFVFYDLQVEYADSVLTAYVPNSKTLCIFFNSFGIVNKKRLRYHVRDAFSEVDKVMFFNLERSEFNQKTPFEKIKDILWHPNALTITWDASNENLIFNADKFGSPYQLRKGSKGVAKRFISAKKLNEKAASIKDHQRIYPSLESQSAYAGLSIPHKPNLKTQGINRKELTDESIEELIFYSTNRTINVFRLLQSDFYKNIIITKQDIINSFNVKAKVDDTDATLSSLVLTHNNTIKFKDSNEISFNLETNQGKVNLLEDLFTRKIIPLRVFKFYKAVEGKNYLNYTTDLNNNLTLLSPYYDKDLKPTDCYANFSFGGNHGMQASEVLDINFNEINKKIFPNKKTQQYFNAFSIDADNCYPTMNVKTKIFINDLTNDYSEMLKESIELKHSLPQHLKDWSNEDKQNFRKRSKLKRILNTATGAADIKGRNRLLPLNNKTMSMRILVNLIIYELGTEYTRKLNAKIISTNTDGIKIAFEDNFDEQAVYAIAEKMSNKYGINFSVKKIDRIMVKDTNNVIEWSKKADGTYSIESINGKLGKGYQGKVPLDGNLDHPVIVDMAVVNFLTAHNNLKAVSDAKTFIMDYLSQHLKNDFKGMQWALFIKPSDKLHFYLKDCKLCGTNRLYFAKEGKTIKCINSNNKETKIRSWTSKTVELINYKYQINKIADNIDIDAYCQWALNALKPWIELEKKQMSIFDIPKQSEQATVINKTKKQLKVKSQNSVLAKYLKERSNIQ